MASQYNVEPQPTAKVILNTTAGDLTIELFAKQAPLASRNFLQHCLDGYYTNTIFHRLVANFIIQGGDPTGTGSGGISAINNGDPFQDEFHSRLKFNRRGLIGMANEGRDSNASQFFFTLAATPELQSKNTMFGRIEGDTIFNLVKMADAELSEGSERPLYPTRVTGAEIILNPFSDMVARVKEAPRTSGNDKAKDLKKRKKPAGKSGLSFGMDDDGEENSVPVVKKLKVNPKMVSAPGELSMKRETASAPSEEQPIAAKVRHRSPEAVKQAKTYAHKSTPALLDKEDDDDDDEEESGPARKRQNKLDETNAEIAALKASMRRGNDTASVPKEKPKSALEAMIPATSIRARKRGKVRDEPGAINAFNAFKQRLNALPAEDLNNDNTTEPTEQPTQATNDGDAEEEAELCDLHFIANCQSCKSWDEKEPAEDAEAEDEDAAGWMSHRLTFARDTLGKDLEWKKKMEEIDVIDPREKARTIKEQSRKARVK